MVSDNSHPIAPAAYTLADNFQQNTGLFCNSQCGLTQPLYTTDNQYLCATPDAYDCPLVSVDILKGVYDRQKKGKIRICNALPGMATDAFYCQGTVRRKRKGKEGSSSLCSSRR